MGRAWPNTSIVCRAAGEAKPPGRAIARRLLRGYVTRRFVIVGFGSGQGPEQSPPPRRDYDFDATAEEVDAEDDERTLPR
jgi:hypothetical protein